MKKADLISKYLDFKYLSPRKRHELYTNDRIINEVFASLEYVSEVDDAAIELLKIYGHMENFRDKQFLFKSYIRQCKTFFESAENLHYRASALNYYYSFMNIAKAFICLSEPDFVKDKNSHGISLKFAESGIQEQQIFLNEFGNGIFGKFYKILFGEDFRLEGSLNVVDLLGYCTDIAYEYQSIGHGNHKNLYCKLLVAINDGGTEAWPVLAIQNFKNRDSFSGYLEKFDNYFMEVDMPLNYICIPFAISNDDHKNSFSYFESKSKYPVSNGDFDLDRIKTDVFQALGNLVSFTPYKADCELFISKPIKFGTDRLLVNEPIAIYLLMFYLGSLVRYYPWYLEKLLSSKEAWLIERFTKTSAITFMRYMSNMIRKIDFIYMAR